MRALAISAALLLASSASFAADNGIYIGGSVGKANVDVDEDLGFELDSDDTGFKAIVGIRPLDFLGFELNYVDLGKPSDDVGGVDIEADTSGIDAFAVGFLPLPLVDLFAKVGVVSWDSKISVEGVQVADDSGEDLAYGVGAQVRFGSIAVRAEYERFEIDNLDDVNLISLGFTWTFL